MTSIIFSLLLNFGIFGIASDTYQSDSIATAYLIDPDKALRDLFHLTPENFCNNWNANLRNYLIYVHNKKENPADTEHKRVKDKIKHSLQITKNILYGQEKITYKYWDEPNLRLIPYMLGISFILVAVGVRYEVLSLDSLVILGLSNALIGYLYNSYFNLIDEDLRLLRYRYKSFQAYWPPINKKYEEYGNRKFIKKPFPDYAFEIREI
jgi:hypothetical protein